MKGSYVQNYREEKEEKERRKEKRIKEAKSMFLIIMHNPLVIDINGRYASAVAHTAAK